MLDSKRMLNINIFPPVEETEYLLKKWQIQHTTIHVDVCALGPDIGLTLLFVPDSLGDLEQIIVPFAVNFLILWCSILCFPLFCLMFQLFT